MIMLNQLYWSNGRIQYVKGTCKNMLCSNTWSTINCGTIAEISADSPPDFGSNWILKWMK